MANHKIAGPWLAKRPWAVSALTAFSTTIVLSALAWSVFGVTKQELRTWTLSASGDKYGQLQVNNGEQVLRPLHDNTNMVEFPSVTELGTKDYLLYCEQGWYMVGIHFTADKPQGTAFAGRPSDYALSVPTAVQIMCVKLIQ